MRRFPTHSRAWLAGLAHHGQPIPDSGVPVLRRAIPGTTLHDGLLSWPYLSVEPQDLRTTLPPETADLVCVVGTVMTSCEIESGDFLQPRTPHYVFDPAGGELKYSARTRAHISRGRRAHRDVDWNPALDAGRLHGAYQQVVRRYDLAGGHFDFPVEHFDYFTGQLDAQAACVFGAAGIAAMACLIRHDDDIHVVHFVVSDEGLHTDAGPFLAAALVERASREGLRVFFAGVPEAGRPGLAAFKERFTNRRQPVWLVRLVLDHDAYAELSGLATTAYFPAYRAP